MASDDGKRYLVLDRCAGVGGASFVRREERRCQTSMEGRKCVWQKAGG